MTTAVFVTGDRAFKLDCGCLKHTLINSAAANGVLVELLKLTTEVAAQGDTLQVITGEETGIDEFVTLACGAAGIDIMRLGTPVDAEGRPDFETRANLALAAGATRAVIIHGDPLASRVGKSTIAAFGDDNVSLVGAPVVA